MRKPHNIVSNPWVKYPLETLTRFQDDNGPLNAAGLSFFMLLSFAPMILAGVAILGRFVTPQDAHIIVLRTLHHFLPEGGASAEAMHLLNDRLNVSADYGLNEAKSYSGIASLIGLLSLIWASMQIFVNASVAMNAAFEVKESRSWIAIRLVALGLLVATGVLLAVSILLSGAPRFLHMEHTPITAFGTTVLFEVIAVVINANLFALIYKELPAAPNTWKSAAIGGIVASLAFEVAKKGMAAFLLRPNASLYGNLANLILFFLWIFYSMMILLIGAEAAAVYARHYEPATVGHPHRTKTVTRAERLKSQEPSRR